jgi:hypothetical protein
MPLMAEKSWMSRPGSEVELVDLQTHRPHPARVYDYLLGGKDNFEADRAAAEEGIKANPSSLVPPRENRGFLRRAVSYLAGEAGIDQFLDIGTGIPTWPNVHEVAQAANPLARVVYVDNDPIVLTHARALLTSHPAGQASYIDADLRNVEEILGSGELHSTLDLSRPVALLLIAIMHFVPTADDPHGVCRRLLDALPAGSYLALSHLTGDFDPVAWEKVSEIYRRNGVIMEVRPRAEIERFFTGLELVEPGVVPVQRWRPDSTDAARWSQPSSTGSTGQPSDAAVSVYGGVAGKP